MLSKFSLTIIIPCFKTIENRDYLTELLCSIQNQKASIFTLAGVILVNDSPENDIEKAVDLSYFNFNILVINNSKNSGQAFSRNIGLQYVKSQYVHFIDQDDFIAENFYSNLDFSTNSDILIAKCLLVKSNKSINHSKTTKEFILKRFTKLNRLKFFLSFDNIVLSPGQVVFNTNVIRKVGGFPVLSNFGSDDYGLMFNLSKDDLTYSYCEKSKFFHRLHETQGKKHLDMGASRAEFLRSVSSDKFSLLCLVNFFPINYVKKMMYIIFYNRL